MLLLRGARAASTAVAGAAAARSVSVRLTTVAALSSSPSSGCRRRKTQRRGEPKTPAPAPPQPLPRHGEAPGKKKPSARLAEGKKTRVAEEELRLPRLEDQARKGTQQPQEKPKRVVRWKCASGCGACCKLDKGPDFPTPDEIFADHPDHLQLYKSMIGTDGWCINYDKPTRTCNIYEGWNQRFSMSSLVWHAADLTEKLAVLAWITSRWCMVRNRQSSKILSV